MTLELVSEEVASPSLSTLYPFNALRNHALLLVRTEVTSHHHTHALRTGPTTAVRTSISVHMVTAS